LLAYETELRVAEQNKINEDAEFELKYKTALILERWKLEQSEAKKLAEQQKKDYEELNRTLTDALMRGFESGKGFAKVFVDTVQNLFSTLILRPIISAIMAPVSGAISAGIGALGFSGSAAAGGAATSGGMLAGMGITTAGGTALSTGAIMALHVAVPVAAAYVIAKYGFGMGNSRENVGGNRLVGEFSRAGFSGGFEQSWKQDGGWFGSDETGVVRTALNSAQSKAFKATVDALQSTFAALGDTIGSTGIRTQQWNVKIDQTGDVTAALVEGMGSQLIPALVHLRETGEDLAQTAQRVNDSFVSTTQLISGLGLGEASAFGSIGIASADARLALVNAAGGLQNFTALAGQFSAAILTPAQQLQVSLDAVGSTFARLNIHGVETNQQFADLVKAELQLGHYDVVTQLLGVSGAFAAITRSAADLAAQLKTDTFSSLVDYQRAVGRAGNAGSGASIDAATSSAAAMLPALQASNAAQAIRNAKANALQAMTDAKIALDNAMAGGISGFLNNMLVRQTYLAAQQYYNSLPSFAGGGAFGGGLRIVGERGPEMEFTGPSRIVSNSDSRSLLDSPALITEIKALRADLNAAQNAIAVNTNRTAKILERFDGNGMPEVRAA